MAKLTQQEFEAKAKAAIGDKYDFSKAIYVNSRTKLPLICPEHGEFWKKPNDIISQYQGCPKCSGFKRVSNTEEFIERAREIHGDKYDYSKSEYKGSQTKLLIKCKNCGLEFWQRPNNHLTGQGCPNKCETSQYWNLESFIERARDIHGDKYDYSKAVYISARDKLEIVCPKHGSFWQTPDSHINGNGCPKCGTEQSSLSKNLSLEEFKERCNKVHHGKYDYSKVRYNNLHDMVTIICPEHGEFQQEANHHLHGSGCPKCWYKVYDLETFISEAKKVHGDKYDYSKAEYKGYEAELEIICPKHGSFWQTPAHHIKGCGCQICNSSQGESYIQKVLTENHIPFETQVKFDGLTGYGGGNLKFDFRIKNTNILIEYQGEQHFRPVEIFGGEEDFRINQFNDNAKRKWCKENGFKLIEINKDLESHGFTKKDKTLIRNTIRTHFTEPS